MPDLAASQATRTYRSMVARTESPWSLMQRLTQLFSSQPSLGRAVLLREGYLYAERPELGFALVDTVKAHHLFDTDRIWIQRGELALAAQRTEFGPYVYLDGPQRGQRVRLLLFDRIGTGEAPSPLHRDFRALRQRLGFDRVMLRHLTEQVLVADLRYGSVWVPSLLEATGAHLELGCEIIPPGAGDTVASFRAQHQRSLRVLAPLRQAMLAGIEEGLPFDEPLTEYGQQDGQLRRFWLRAYMARRPTYEINKDRYLTFDLQGRPRVPQVCVDFVLDTLERASGTWWRPRGQLPGRVIGNLDFGTMADETLRRVDRFIQLAQTETDWFDLHEFPPAERVSLKYSAELAAYLTAQADRFLPGDIVLIRGYAPWDRAAVPRVMHFHSLFVYETDPVTGFPSMLVGNPARPLLQTWQFEAFRTPDRSIWYRIRPRLSWLERVVQAGAEDPTTLPPASLSAGPT
jgi:hypothetical protein